MGEQNSDNRPVVAIISTRMDIVRRMIGLVNVDHKRNVQVHLLRHQSA
jgi:hypothetical protein